MTYLNNCILETARLEMQGNPWRLSMFDQSFNNFSVPKGTLISLYAQSVHRDPSLFQGPKNFARFLLFLFDFLIFFNIFLLLFFNFLIFTLFLYFYFYLFIYFSFVFYFFVFIFYYFFFFFIFYYSVSKIFKKILRNF